VQKRIFRTGHVIQQKKLNFIQIAKILTCLRNKIHQKVIGKERYLKITFGGFL
jgi:hypothetical protein